MHCPLRRQTTWTCRKNQVQQVMSEEGEANARLSRAVAAAALCCPLQLYFC